MKRLLKQTDRRIVAVALDCGFNSHSHLSKQFRQFTGMTPKEPEFDDSALPSPPAPLPNLGEGRNGLKSFIYRSVPLPPKLRLTPRFGGGGGGVRGWGPDSCRTDVYSTIKPRCCSRQSV
ncbi:helix-turn-helix domain-containing protein [Synechococcus sp. PCC 7336]|uniref:helix-turn-helix domain-containing protein n=1 Tax=Synechococcus sp. PCC 7336 TaxID=195250 RepID=UPI00350FD0FA